MLIPNPVVAIASAIAPARRDFLRIDPPVVVVVKLYSVVLEKPMLWL